MEIWNNRKKILEGIWNLLIGKYKKVAKERKKICQACVHYDKNGSSKLAVIKGKPACDICGCNIQILTNSMLASCSLEDIDKTPKWTAHEEG